MLRLLSRIHVQTQQTVILNRRLIQIFSGQKKFERKRPLYKDLDNHNDLTKFFLESDRHQLFQKNSNHIYQFDDETRNIITWNYTKSQPNCAWNKPTADYEDEEMISAFENLLNHCTANEISLCDTQFDSFIDEFTERLQNFTLNDVIRVLQMFARHTNNKHQIRQRNFIELYQALDQVCTIKSEDLLPDQLLFIQSIWFKIPLAKQTFFAQLASRLFNRYFKTMTAPQMAQAMFYMNCMSQHVIDIRAFENVFEEKIDDLTLEEFAAILWTFIRLDTKLEKQELRHKFFDYLEKQDLNQLSDSTLTKVLVITSRIHTETKSTKWADISRKLQSNLDCRSLKTCILMTNVGAPIRLFDNDMILNVFQRCLNHPDEFEELSLADLEYLSRILTMSSYENVETLRTVGHLILDEIIKNRLDQVAARSVYTHFINIVRNLTMIDVYDLELMNNIFRPDYIKFIHKASKQIDMQMYEIDGYNRLNLKGIYNGNVLEDEYLDRQCYLIDWIPNREERYRKHNENAYVIEDVVRKLFSYCKFAHIVAHRRHADLIVCFDKKHLKPVDISNNFPEPYKGRHIEASRLTNDNSNMILFAFVAGNTKEFSSSMFGHKKCESIPIGYLAQKIQQIKLLGFHPIVIPSHVWKENGSVSVEQFIINEVNKHFRTIGLEHQLRMDLNTD